MNITLLGATGKTGLEVINEAISAGHSVTALVRREGSIPTGDKLNVIVGDVTNATDITKASENSDVIVSTLGSMKGTLMTDTVKAIISSTKKTGVKRIILMSSFAVRKDNLSGGTKLMTGLVMGDAVKDKAKSERLLRESHLDWTIVYPTGLTNDGKKSKVRLVDGNEKVGMKNKITRTDVAAWIVEEITNKAYSKASPIITS